jgi:hypothetical protein
MIGAQRSWLLASLLLSVGCGADTRTGECAKLARAVNTQLDRIEALYHAAPAKKVDWVQISRLYTSLAKDLKSRKLVDPRLVPMVNEYALLVDLAGRNAMNVAGVQKAGNPLEPPLDVLRRQAEQHARLTQRIDRTCKMQ